jgi:phosphatidylethanolamine/phosphatidyl-N-methylethanolamine N-methyltransferase
MAGTPPSAAGAVDQSFVKRVYSRLANVYDWAFGPLLHAGREAAIERLHLHPGSLVLEVGVGTGLTTSLYPRDCFVVGVDISPPMLRKAAARLGRLRLRHVRLLEMDAARMAFGDESFDAVWASYLISVAPDPVKVLREMHRVCRGGGRIVLLNHFASEGGVLASAEKLVGPLTPYLGFESHISLPWLLTQARLQPVSIEKVNRPPLWSLVTCVKEPAADRDAFTDRRSAASVPLWVR